MPFSEPEIPGNVVDAMSKTVRVLVVDDDDSVRAVISAALSLDDRVEVLGEASDGQEAYEKALKLRPDVVLMDVEMPRVDGCEAAQRIHEHNADITIVALTGHIDANAITRMIVAGASAYAVKGSNPDQVVETVVAAAHGKTLIDAEAMPGIFESVVDLMREERTRRKEAEELAVDLKRSYQETVRALVTALQSRDTATEAHGDRVAQRVTAVAVELGLDQQQQDDLQYGAVFHDIGKIGVPDSILHNTDDLTDSEWDVVKRHTIVGESIIRPIGFLRNVARIVRHSHERWDGSGYPDGLAGEMIPIESRIIFACDAYDAMTTNRTYQNAMPHDAACARMHELSGMHFDPKVVDALIHVLAVEGRHAHA